ncbi:MAG: ABC transporter permease [Chryseobacterium sp.]|nr:MAG: ABC transporter permease [Chryseobacterium sp.]
MIRLSDSIILATTKLRTRKTRTILAIFISALLFGLLVAASLISSGSFKSIEKFSSEGYGDRYLVRVEHDLSDPGSLQDKSVWNRAEQIYKETITEKKTFAKSLGIEYDESSEIKPVLENPQGVEDKYLNLQSPSALKAMTERKAPKSLFRMPELKELAKAYRPKAFYLSEQIAAKDGNLNPMKDGEEKFELQTNYTNQPTNPASLGLSVTNATLLAPFTGSSEKQLDRSSSIPILVSYSDAEKELGLQPLDRSSSAAKKIERIKEINVKSSTITFESCYRNSASQQNVQEALRTLKYIQENKDKANYIKPKITYELPKTDTCGPVQTTSDTRTNSEKLIEQKQKQFDAKFGAVVVPDQQKVKFHVVGVLPTAEDDYASAETANDVLKSLVGTNASFGTTSPDNLYNSISNLDRLKQVFAPATSQLFAVPPEAYYVEFSRSEDARQFIRDKGCTTRQDGSCWSPERPFQLFAFGSNSLAVDDLKEKTVSIIGYVALVVAVLAAIIMGSTVGRMIADSRKESAIFRAVGFRRVDIAMIYIVYYLMLSTLISLISLTLGFCVAYTIERMYSADITMQAQLAFNVTDFSKTFNLIHIDLTQMGLIIFGVFAVGMAGILIPLIRNVRRNPINDLRDE